MPYLRRNILEMAGYVPGYQPSDHSWIKLNTNENPFPPSPKVIDAIHCAAEHDLQKYPDPHSAEGRRVAAELYGYPQDWVIMANGSDEILNNLIRACASEGEEIGYLHPSYSYYATLAEIQGARIKTFRLSEDRDILDFPERYKGRVFFLTNPNAPLGLSWSIEEVSALADRCDGLFVVDEAYADFSSSNCLQLVRDKKNVVVTRTLSKSYSLAGMRLGLAIARPEIIRALDKIRDHYNLDRLAQAAVVAALKDQDYFQECIRQICTTRDWFRGELISRGYQVLPSSANYVFVSAEDRNGKRLYQRLYEHKILVRHFDDPALNHGVRISIGSREEMHKTLEVLS